MARKRQDPPRPRSADGRRLDDHITNADPRMHYVYANPSDESTGVAFYESLGYQLVPMTKDGPRSAVSRSTKEGQVVTVRNQVLMCRPLEEHELDVSQGQKAADALDRRLKEGRQIDRDGLGGGVRLGIDRDPNFTSEPFTELENGA